MKILVYGAGVLGCNLARNLLRAGKDVTLLARGNWAAEIRRNGLRIKDKFSLRTSVSRIPVVTELAPDAMYDVIFVVLRYTQLDSVLDTLRANRTKNIVFVGNNVQARALAAALPGKNVLFAFALSAGHRESDRVVSIDLKKITIGQLPGTAANKQLIGRIFHGTKYKVVYEPNMEDYLLCHAAFVMPAAFACYKTDGDLKKLRGDTAYLNRLLDANIEGYRAIRNAGHTILPKEDADFEGEKYRKTCLRFFKLMCATSLGKLCASDHAMNAIDEMSALNRDLRKFFDEHGAANDVQLEAVTLFKLRQFGDDLFVFRLCFFRNRFCRIGIIAEHRRQLLLKRACKQYPHSHGHTYVFHCTVSLHSPLFAISRSKTSPSARTSRCPADSVP